MANLDSKDINHRRVCRYNDIIVFVSFCLELCLSSDFPSFTLCRMHTPTVTIEANPIVGEPPIVRVPMNSELEVVQPDGDTDTARILIKLPASKKRRNVKSLPERQYYLQHERATVGGTGSDYLHLYGTLDS